MRYKIEIQAYSSILTLFIIILIATRIAIGDKSIESVSITTPPDSTPISAKYATDTLHINTATLRQLKRFGFSYYELYNIVSYREAGGKIRDWNKLANIYGIDTLKHYANKHRIAYDDIFVSDKNISPQSSYEHSHNKLKNKQIAPQKQISLFYTDSAELVDYGIDQAVIDSLLWYRKNYIVSGKMRVDTLQMASASTIGSYLKPHLSNKKKAPTKTKANATTKIELNAATAEELRQIRFVGEYTANKILEYRQKLGGYVSADQLREINALSKNEKIEQIIMNVTADQTNITKIKINTIDLKKLKQHPYASEKMCTALLVSRKTNNEITSLSHFRHIMTNVQYNPFLEEYLQFE